jgi:hypothetical protein
MMSMKQRLVGGSLVALGAVWMLNTVLSQTVTSQVRAALVKEVDQPARQNVMIKRNTSSSIFEDIYTVPVGKKLVVEHLNCSSLSASDIYVGLFVGGLNHANIFYSVPFVAETANVKVHDGSTQIYFEPGATIQLRIFTAGNTTCTIAGHTVDVTP